MAAELIFPSCVHWAPRLQCASCAFARFHCLSPYDGLPVGCQMKRGSRPPSRPSSQSLHVHALFVPLLLQLLCCETCFVLYYRAAGGQNIPNPGFMGRIISAARKSPDSASVMTAGDACVLRPSCMPSTLIAQSEHTSWMPPIYSAELIPLNDLAILLNIST